MLFPDYRDELIAMLEQDQQEVKAQSHSVKCSPNAPAVVADEKRLAQRCAQRAERMLAILAEIKTPTLDRIGEDGSEAMGVIALHAKYAIMKRVLVAFEAAYKGNPVNTYRQIIPALTDRVLMLERKKQRFGSQWLMGKNGRFFFYPVEEFQHMNERRAQYGLHKARHPRDLTYGVPKGPLPPYTRECDQRQPTPEEYENNLSELLD